jgi:hypothetical protein
VQGKAEDIAGHTKALIPLPAGKSEFSRAATVTVYDDLLP